MDMKMVGLTAYGFCIKNEQEKRIELHDVDGREIIDILNTEIQNEINTYTDDRSDERVFCYDQNEIGIEYNGEKQEIFKILYSRVKTGEYGMQSEIVNSKTGIVSHKKTEDEADVMPFGFAVCVAAGEVNTGIIVLQSIGNRGIKVALHKRLNKIVKDYNDDYRLEMGVIVPRIVLNRFFKQGVLQSIRFIQYEIPEEDAERFGINHNTEESYKETIIRKPTGFLRNKARELAEWMNGTRMYSDVVQIEGFEYDELKMDFKLGRTSKTISLRNIDNLQMTEDVTRDVILEGGHPTFNSLKEVLKKTGNDYSVAKGLIIEQE